VAGIAVCRLDKRDVVRHPLVARIVEAYEQHDEAQKDASQNRAALPGAAGT